MRDKLRPFYPFIFAILGVVLYQILISPIITDMRADWQFLHDARMGAIQQQIRQQQNQQSQSQSQSQPQKPEQ